MSRLAHISLRTRYQDEGNLLRTTALETAVLPTLKASAISARPRVSAIARCVTMSFLYPHQVDYIKTTIGGLPKLIEASERAPTARDIALPYEDIGERLRAVREHFSDLSQKDWAEKHGFAQTQYNNWEKGTRRITVDAAEKLCEAYGLTLDAIYRGRLDGLSENLRKVL